MLFLLRPLYIDLGIDLGTANTIVWAKKRGFIINQASYITLNQKYQMVALGNAAKEMMGKTASFLKVIRPLADGVITDFEAGSSLIRGFIGSAKISRFRIGRVVMGVPTGINQVEKRAMIEAAKSAGSKEVFLIAEPMAAAIGLGLDVKGKEANMIVDIGGGTTDIAVINYGGIVVDNTIGIAGDELDIAIMAYLRREYNLKIGEITAEKLKIQFASLLEKIDSKVFHLKTLDYISGSAKKVEFPVVLFKNVLGQIIGRIISAILHVLEILPAELSSDIIERGIILTGGGALLPGLDALIQKKTNLHVTVPDNPLYTVAMGTREVLSDFNYYEEILMKNTSGFRFKTGRLAKHTFFNRFRRFVG